MAELMKNGLNEAALRRIAASFARTSSSFDEKHFVQEALQGLDALELKQRVNRIIVVLADVLPSDFTEAASLLMRLKEHWDWGNPDDNLRGFAAWPVIDYVAVHGLEHPDVALPVLRTLTPMFSAEFAIRHFLLAHPAETLAVMEAWTHDPDEHVRRLVSEGSRTRLPWGVRLKPFISDPAPVLPLLEALKDDESLYVRRSVANNLNDLAKDHPALVIETCRRWHQGASEERLWLIRHATRTLVKQGHPDVFGLLGYTESPVLVVDTLTLVSDALVLGDALAFDVHLTSEASTPQHVVVDYALHLKKANGETKPKVFKLKNVRLEPGETKHLRKRHLLRQITTRTYYPGEQALEIFINGKAYAKIPFNLSL